MHRIVFGFLAVTLLGLFFVPNAPAQDATPSVAAGRSSP